MVTVLFPGEENWLSTNEPSRFSRDFNLRRCAGWTPGENVSVLARELGVSRKSIYKWRDRYRLGGSDALRAAVVGPKAERWLTHKPPWRSWRGRSVELRRWKQDRTATSRARLFDYF